MKYFVLLSGLILFVVNSNDGCLIPNPNPHFGAAMAKREEEPEKWEKIRIHVEYDENKFYQPLLDFFKLVFNITDLGVVKEKANDIQEKIKKDIIDWSVTEVTKFVRVRKESEKMYIYDEECGVRGLEEEYNADLVLLISLKLCDNMQELTAVQILARAKLESGYELLHQKNALSYICSRADKHRPNAGAMILCVDAISQRFNENLDGWRAVFLHELLHVMLDFLHGTNYVDESGNVQKHTYSQGLRRWKSKINTYDVPTFSSKLPHLKEFAKTHFGCPLLTGLELNHDVTEVDVLNYLIDRPTPPTIQSFNHFEERLFPDALMSPVVRLGKTITKLELAALKDTGWYKIDETYPFAELTDTRNKGCDYALMSCYEYMEKHHFKRESIYPYCNPDPKADPRAGVWGCSADYDKAVGCTVKPMTDVEKLIIEKKFPFFYIYENFVGTEMQADGCGMVVILPVELSTDPLCYSADIKGVGNRACSDVRVKYKEQHYSEQTYGRCANFSCDGDKIHLYYRGLNFTCDKDETGPQKYEDDKREFKVDIYCPNVTAVCKQRKAKERAKSQTSFSSKPIPCFDHLKMACVLISVILMVRYFSEI